MPGFDIGSDSGQLLTGTCAPWATIADVCSPCDDYAFDTVILESGLQVASDVLYELTGRRWPGECLDVVRPCGYRTATMWTPTGLGWCGCSSSRMCGCRRLSEIQLPGYPVVEVTEVKIDGVALAAERYRLDDHRWLVYLPESDSAERQGWPCFPSGTLVLTSTGLRPIEAIQAGEMVLTHRNRWRRVVRSGKTGDSELVRVTGRGGSVRCTPDHQLLAAELSTGGYAKNGKHPLKLGQPEWVEATALTGHAWATPNRIDPLPIPEPCATVPANFWWMVGRWVGDGWTDKNRVVLCCGAHEADRLATTLSALGWDWRRSDQRTGSRFRLADGALAAWLRDHFGVGAAAKTLPGWLMAAPEAIRSEFLAGYVSADGWRATPPGRNPFTSVTTVSRRLAQSVRLLVASLGFAPMLYEGRQQTQTIEGRSVNGRPTYRVDWPDTAPGGRHSQAWSDDAHLWGRVQSVELLPLVVPVYDLEVEEDHSFVADGFVVHNCCQRIDRADTEDDTWSVSYLHGTDPPEGGRVAAAVLGCEMALSCQPETVNRCRLPKRVTSITRQGVSMAILDPLTLFADGLTGLPEVDLWVSSLRHGQSRRRASVWVPGQHQPSVRRTNT